MLESANTAKAEPLSAFQLMLNANLASVRVNCKIKYYITSSCDIRGARTFLDGPGEASDVLG